MLAPRRPFAIFVLLLLLSVWLAPASARQGAPTSLPLPTSPPAQTPAATPPADDLLREFQDSVKRLESREDLESATKTEAIEAYTAATVSRNRELELRSGAAEFRRVAEQAPGQLVTVRERLAGPATVVEPEVPNGATLADFEQRLAQAEAELKAARDLSNELQADATKRQNRRAEIPTQIASARQRLGEIEERLSDLSPTDASGVSAEARRALLEQQARTLRAEIELYESELASYDARRPLLPARRDLALRRVTENEQLVAFWQSRVTERRRLDAEQAARDAKRAALDAARQHPVLQKYAEVNKSLAEERASPDGLPEQMEEAARALEASRSGLSAMRQQYRSLTRRVDVSGLNRATGLLLRKQYEKLPDLETLAQNLDSTERTLGQIEYELIERQEEQIGAGDIDRVVGDLMSSIDAKLSDENRRDIESAARELAVARRDLVNERVDDATRSFDLLIELAQVQREELDAARAFRRYIEERILWVRSIAKGRLPLEEGMDAAGEWLLDAGAWQDSFDRVRETVSRRWAAVTPLLFLCVMAVVLRRMCKSRLRELSGTVASFRTDSYASTVSALVATALAALQTPLLLWVVGWIVSMPGDPDHVLSDFGLAFRRAGLFLYPLSFLWIALRRDGLVMAHFRWPEEVAGAIRRTLHWFIPIVLPIVVFAVAVRARQDEDLTSTAGRLALSVGLLALSVALQRLLRPSGAVMSNVRSSHRGTWLDRLRYVWYPLVVSAPIGLAVLSWSGFHYTALQLERRIELTIVLVLVLMLINGMLMRWLFLARRRVAVENARRRREQALAEAAAQAEHDGHEVETDPDRIASVEDEDALDLPAISAQTKQLFRASLAVSIVIGLFAIWADVLPALRMLDRVQIWPEVRVVESPTTLNEPMLDSGSSLARVPEAATNTNGANAKNSGETLPLSNGMAMPGAPSLTPDPQTDGAANGAGAVPMSVTLADLGFALITLVATIVFFRNLPGLVEIVILQRLPLDAGSRYALGTVLRYIIAGIGLVIASNALGLSWTKVQWLAAALTFGLAFGLQEIFANFVSGLIILAERPIRLGDTVTVGNTTGTVMRIKMRATTITDWDRKELVIPNKTFITSDVVNWTLGDTILRITIPVGVSYHSDVDKVERTLKKIAKKVKVIMDSPAPQIVFRSFGDSTLNFELRVFIPRLDLIPGIYHTMHMEIFKTFQKEGIEIAFPQRDLNIRSSDVVFQHAVKREDLPPAADPATPESDS